MRIDPKDERLEYMGRVDFDSAGGPTLVFPCTNVKLLITGTTGLSVRLINHRSWADNYMGVITDGEQKCICIYNEDSPNNNDLFTLAENLDPAKVHEIMLFKRMDSCHTVQIAEFIADDGAELKPCHTKYKRKLEFYGDSVTAGEVSEAIDYCKKNDPVNKGEYSNSYWSYAWITARLLDAQIHDIAQGGISLLDDTGWYAGPDYKGIFNMYDRIEYNPDLGVTKRFDFSSYMPDTVIIAIGQNDANPVNFMAEDYEGDMAELWRRSYEYFVSLIRKRRPDADIVLTTTILGHDPAWDRAIDEVCNKMRAKDTKIHHFMYTNNGCGTPGHIRKPEAEVMAQELKSFLLSLRS
ncbi:MAG: electron transporter RnfD [Lachnospiraceae bacterium]|nr:electron transporter RnfD [Lachnospiraceae bacterium]